MGQENNKQHISFLNARVTSIISISLVLFLLGIIVSLSILGTQLTKHIKENMGFSVIIKDSASEDNIEEIKGVLDKAPYVKAIRFISKEDALKELSLELGENPEDLLGYNPLQSSIEIKLTAEYASTDSLAKIETNMLSFDKAVSEVICQKDVIQSINDNLHKAEIILLSVSIILMIISFALISNTIRLMVYSRRFLIHTMKLVGATPGFIRRPFILNNIIDGIIAAGITIVLLIGCMFYLSSEFEGYAIPINFITMIKVFGIVLILGILLTATSAYFAVNRYISMNRDELYHI